MRSIIAFVVVILLIAGAGGWYAKKEVTKQASNKVVAELNTPSGQAEFHKILQDPKVQGELAQLRQSNSGNLHFDSEQQAVQYAMNKLSIKETLQLAQDYLHRNSLTEQQKVQIENEVLSKFTPQELAAIAKAMPSN
ncbi:hypothetical protein [Alicyclobacillus kakegawensis]|uniref:hypothetical protein n=1 Tax=Alicyclobacillus kakegawensis TaxID=392012 RepID=UPI0008342833|nr:hypothetical protein [Alicyclobacillus kakegawensis]